MFNPSTPKITKKATFAEKILDA